MKAIKFKRAFFNSKNYCRTRIKSSHSVSILFDEEGEAVEYYVDVEAFLLLELDEGIHRLAVVSVYENSIPTRWQIPVVNRERPFDYGRIVPIHSINGKVIFHGEIENTHVLETPQHLSKERHDN